MQPLFSILNEKNTRGRQRTHGPIKNTRGVGLRGKLSQTSKHSSDQRLDRLHELFVEHLVREHGRAGAASLAQRQQPVGRGEGLRDGGGVLLRGGGQEATLAAILHERTQQTSGDGSRRDVLKEEAEAKAERQVRLPPPPWLLWPPPWLLPPLPAPSQLADPIDRPSYFPTPVYHPLPDPTVDRVCSQMMVSAGLSSESLTYLNDVCLRPA